MKFPILSQYEWVAPDTETTGLDWHLGDKAFSVAIALPTGDKEYYDFRHQPEAFHWAKEQFPKIRRAVNHNIKFDIHMLRMVGIHLPAEVCECTMIRAALITEHLLDYSLDYLARKYLKEHKVDTIYAELAALFGGQPTRKAQAPNFHRAPYRMMHGYAIKDADLAARLWEWQEVEMARQDLGEVWALEKRLFPHIVESEVAGIRVDIDLAERRIPELDKKEQEINREIKRETGLNINVNSNADMKKVFKPVQNGVDVQGRPVWVTSKGELLQNTKTGNASLAADVLKSLKDPVARMIVNARKTIKTRDTFVKGHILGKHKDGRVHPNINQTKSDDSEGGNVEGTGTGRLSYTRPALQQIPSRDVETAKMIRPIFLPERGQKWSYGDLDQHEFRIFAHYAKPKQLLAEYARNPNLDMHQIVADMTGLPRSAKESGGANAKQINLAMVFNMGGGELADRMGLPFTWDSAVFDDDDEARWFKRAGDEAMEVMERYYTAVPGVRETARQASSLAKSRQYIRTMYGRRIHFPGGKFNYKASGLLYQGTAADFNKKNICLIAEYIKSECPHNRFLINIHDEYSMSLLDEKDITIKHLKEMKALIEDKGLRVPIRIDFSQLANNWWDATQAPLATA